MKSSNLKGLCELAGYHGITIITCCYDTDMKKVRIFEVCKCCNNVEEIDEANNNT